MSEIVNTLKDGDLNAMVISDHDRMALTELLSFIAVLLQEGKLWINSKDSDQTPYILLCERTAGMLANLKVNQSN